MKIKAILTMLFAILLAVPSSAKAKHTFEIKDGNFVYDGKAIQIHSGEMHYSRVPPPYWHHRLKMMKAMGLNAVATYVFWNNHEVAPGKWDWTTGNRNIRAFLNAASDEGMMVILRPGPYACGEWEFGGYPWWLQKVKGMEIRTYNQPFLDSCRVYINELAAQVTDYQITKGGPIVMVQAENEFGSYVEQRPDVSLEMHRKYSGAIKDMLIEAGFNIPMFTSDGSWLFEGGVIDGALPTANGEDDVENLRNTVNQYHGGVGPYMVAEFYPGWLDHWNEPFVKRTAERMVKQTKKYLDAGVSFNYYMVHGGTNFGFTAGANYNNERNIQPDITSYDYDAPISEAGWATPKYEALRELIKKYVKYDVPSVPERQPVISVPGIKLTNTVGLFDMLESAEPVESDTLLTFEDMNQGYGYMLYRRHFNQPISGMMRVPGIADFATVYVNGEKVGELNRMTGKDSMQIKVPFNATLDILVENMGRINFGTRINANRKGIIQPIIINGHKITGDWQMYGVPMDVMPVMPKMHSPYVKGQPTLYFGTFELDNVGDTFLDMEKWGKGIVFVNGVNLGRYWKIGPQQTLYLPGCFLHKGQNTVVVFEQLNDEKKTQIVGVETPVLDKLMKE
ncbi:beta-galactosidase [Prevotella sp.]|uniref:beta-galactosidase n=1 Tax=Prevotella sp. TaxID=59823 RepID=UPI0027E2D0F9|nr:beta-galactosidase [Prevotella sp.]